MSNFFSGWYVIYTMPRHEKKVSATLGFRSITFLLPVIKTLRTWNNRKKIIEMPLFPSYIFVYLDNIDTYFEVLQMPGVLYYVKDGKKVALVSDTVINNIRLITPLEQEVEITQDHFQPGRKVIILEGTLKDLAAEVVEVQGKEKLMVRVHMLQRNILISMPKEQLSCTYA